MKDARAWSHYDSRQTQQFSWRVYECGDSEILQDARKNTYHNGHPDMIRQACFPATQHNTPPRESKSKRLATRRDGKVITLRYVADGIRL